MKEARRSGHGTLPLEVVQRLDALCDRLEAAWQAAASGTPRPRLEEYVAEVTEEERPYLLRELIPLDIAYRRDHGEQPQAAEYQSRFPELDLAWLAGLIGTPPAEASAPPPTPSLNLPHYELLALLGRGGMGVVYAARDRRLNREVAIKLLRDEYAHDERLAARFTAEAQITGQLQHPGIPAVHELGATTDGRPFLAMKLVKGKTLAALQQEQTSPNALRGQLLAIFEQICQAVAYAHAHRVIHRDLKPGNVMVGKFGEVQVMDWGLAKLLPAEGTPPPESEAALPDTGPPITDIETPPGRGSATRTGQVLGTPAYMAPEQAGGERHRVDCRSDVFGLGAILCEVLTGRPPYQAPDVNAVRLKAVRGELGEALSRLEACGAEPELVALCRRCLAFRPQDRPADGGVVAATVAGIRAAAEERARRAESERAEAVVREAEQRKRRRVWLGLAASLLVGVLAATGLALWADHSRRQAQERQAETAAILDFVEQQLFAAAEPETRGGLGRDVTLRQALERALVFVDERFSGPPLIEARLRRTLGSLFWRLGEPGISSRQQERAQELLKQLLGLDHPATLQCMNGLALSYLDLGRFDDARRLCEETLALQRTKLGPDHPDTLSTRSSLANTYDACGRPDDAASLRKETLKLAKARLGPDHPDTLKYMANLASGYANQGHHEKALELRKEMLELQKRKFGSDDPDTLMGMNNLANSYQAVGRDADALKLREEALPLMQVKLGLDHPHTLMCMNNLALSYANEGREVEALKLREQTLELRRRKFGPDHAGTLNSMNSLALSYFGLGRYVDAVALLQDTVKRRKRTLRPDHPDTLYSMKALATTYIVLRQSAEAVALLEEMLALWQKRAAQPENWTAQLAVASVHGQWGQAEEARQQFAAAIRRYALALEGFERLDKAGKLQNSDYRHERDTCRRSIVLCGKVQQAVADLDYALKQPADEVPDLLDARLRVLLGKKDRAGVAATAAAWHHLAEKDREQCYAAAAAWSLARRVADEQEGTADAAKARECLKRALEAKKPSATPLLLAWRLEQDPDFAPLRSEPAFAAFVNELHAMEKAALPDASTRKD